MEMNQMSKLVESVTPATFSACIDEGGNISLTQDMFSEAIKGLNEAAFRIRECLTCSQIFWAKNSKTVVCIRHRKARRDVRRNIGTKRSRLSGSEKKRPPKDVFSVSVYEAMISPAH